MNDEPNSLKQKRKFHAMVRDVARQVQWDGEWLNEDEWKLRIFAGFYGQHIVPNVFYDASNPMSQPFLITNKQRTRDIAKSGDVSMAELITQMLAFGAEKGVEWTDPEWKSMREQEQRDAQRMAA